MIDIKDIETISKTINLNPAYQRDYIAHERKDWQQKLIGSIFEGNRVIPNLYARVSDKDMVTEVSKYIDSKGKFKPTDDAPQYIKDLQATGVTSTGIKIKGYSAPPGEKDPIIGSANKIICTAMHDMAGFGSYRNTIWQNYAKNAYKNDNVQLGYHKVFANLTKKMYNSPRLSKFLGYFARNRTAYIRNKMRNKPNSLGSTILWNTIESGLYILGAAISRGWLKKKKL